MSQTSKLKHDSINHLREPFKILIWDWKINVRHRHLPDITLHGQTSFCCLDGSAFLKYESKMDELEISDAISVIGRDNTANKFSVLYYNTRFNCSIYNSRLDYLF